MERQHFENILMFLDRKLGALLISTTRFIVLRIGRKQLIYETTEMQIVKDVSKNPHLIEKDIVNDIQTAKLDISTKTVIRCIHSAGLVVKEKRPY